MDKATLTKVNLTDDQVESLAQALLDRGYAGFSNKYRIVARIDRPDWIEVMARAYNRAPIDFIIRPLGDGTVTNVSDQWKRHYAVTFSKDSISEINELVYQRLKRLNAYSDMEYKPI